RRAGHSRVPRDGRRLSGLRRGRHYAEGGHRATHQGRGSGSRRGPRHDGPRRREQSVLHAGQDVALARLLLLLPTRTYRTEAFVVAAHGLGVDLVCASERPSTLEDLAPDSLLTLDFTDPDAAALHVTEWSRRRPLDAVVGVDDQTATTAAAIAERVGLRPSPVAAVAAGRKQDGTGRR